MKRVAVIAEYNPFHKGHHYLLKAIRDRLGKDTEIVIIMSGSFVQRGEPALFDKWHRASWALRCGADVVIELPLVYVVSSASGFANGAVRLAAALGCHTIACGVETGTAADFYRLATEAVRLNTLPISKDHQGKPFGQYVTEELCHRCPAQKHLLTAPNALLALEYTKAMIMYAPEMKLLPIRRLGTTHDEAISHAVFASASALRAYITARKSSCVGPYVPTLVNNDIEALLRQGRVTAYSRYHDIALYANRLTTPEQLRSYPAFTEGIEYRWHRVMAASPTWDEAISTIKTKRYTYSRLCRMGVYTTLQIPQSLLSQSYKEGPQYARLLGLTRRGGTIIKESKKNIPIITKIKTNSTSLSSLGQLQLHYDIRGTDIQSLSMKDSAFRRGQQDFTTSPSIITSTKI